ncbi:hypothetical protein N5D77_26265 [Comamonas thiooxydans]|uniref:Uncharacterized protein n=1 Tax=Comamonas thiooxydans TaxID=363952 RepID=A0AA42QA79_9BURK|nr:hypothetical protein [Comamonas thiooxydans]MDH1337553.1 hypothetical protein [Comamonas thiooxydans]MDH1743548.1 hypothetical protein [Comamonas thiooxydans]MDH1790059.1 hypothetical protein [Comamonas thiooxydans]
MSLTFVNHNGDPITDSRMAAMRAQGMELERQRHLAAKSDAVSVHKGWRVSGIAPGLLDEAKQAHERLCQMAQKAGGKPPEPFDEAAWLRTAKRTAVRTAVRSKPYPLQEAAQLCKKLAIKTGWLDVQLQEIKKTVA